MAYIYGRNPSIEYIRSGKDVRKIYIKEGENKGNINKIIKEKRLSKIIEYVDKDVLDEYSDYGNHQGIVLEVSDFTYSSMAEILNNDSENQLVIILDEITDPHNLGAIIRTCETCGGSGVIIQNKRASQVNETVHKTSAGATNYVKIMRATNITNTIKELKEEGFWIYGASGNAESLYTDLTYSGKVGLVIGNEGKGISRLVEKNCDFLIKIPMYGKIDSLNASVSAGILMYEIIKDFNNG